MKATARGRTKSQVVGEFRREEILCAARRIFARKGFAAGIMEDIAREAGIAKGTIYLYFRSKDEVFRALLAHDMRQLKETMFVRLDQAPTLKEKIRAFLLTRLENVEAKREFFRIMDSEQLHLAMTRHQFRDFLHGPVEKLAAAIEEEMNAGRIRRVDPLKTSWLVADALRGAIQRRLLTQSPPPPEEDADFLLDFFWTSLSATMR
jgi:AcrR family transcriptional regulator